MDQGLGEHNATFPYINAYSQIEAPLGKMALEASLSLYYSVIVYISNTQQGENIHGI